MLTGIGIGPDVFVILIHAVFVKLGLYMHLIPYTAIIGLNYTVTGLLSVRHHS